MKKKRTFGYEVVFVCNTDFQEDLVRSCFTASVKGMEMYCQKFSKMKIVSRVLQPDELPKLTLRNKDYGNKHNG